MRTGTLGVLGGPEPKFLLAEQLGVFEGPEPKFLVEQNKFPPFLLSPVSLLHGTTPLSILKTLKYTQKSVNNQSSSSVNFTPQVCIQEYGIALAPNGWQ